MINVYYVPYMFSLNMHELNLYSAHNEGKSVTAEKFIKAAKAKNYKER